ncbi:quinol oxidase [Colwellia sp. MT41]|uniref:DoxD-like inner membrane protein n=1 Tax=Colwellia marinimaniae TaxID=1513592 RepID=A0ABQ0MVM8_9GAMM|nr:MULTISPECIES: DoxX family protein [Colwellia]ALO34852.1 quinol oxidase [Colwellia sp. MT41]GAW96423.1 DoxD-like inner membrane protein [Colwellia marinimaniae]
MQTLQHYYQRFLSQLKHFDGIPALLLRLYLAPVFIMAGFSKTQLLNEDVTGFSAILADASIIAWFGNSDWGLGLPFPALLANLVILVEFFGGWLLLIGALTRLISIPLMFTMIVAATTVHVDNGWFAITPTNSEISPARVASWLGLESAQGSLANSEQTAIRLEKMRELLAEHGNTDWLYEKGNIVVLNNGIEFSTTYFIMLLALFFIGAGRYTSVDHYLAQRFLMVEKR